MYSLWKSKSIISIRTIHVSILQKTIFTKKTIQAYIKKQAKSQINNLTLHLVALGKKQQRKPKASRRREKIRIRREINDMETKKQNKTNHKTKQKRKENRTDQGDQQLLFWHIFAFHPCMSHIILKDPRCSLDMAYFFVPVRVLLLSKKHHFTKSIPLLVFNNLRESRNLRDFLVDKFSRLVTNWVLLGFRAWSEISARENHVSEAKARGLRECSGLCPWGTLPGSSTILASNYFGLTGRKEKGDPLNIAIDKMTKKTRDLRRQLRKAVMDHISDSFLETNVPLLVLIEAAKSGNEKEVKEYAQVFREHANKLVEVINAALTLAARPQSKVAQDNMDVFKDQWEKQVRVLTEAVDDITSVDDFLSVSENHILEDVNKCVIALQEGDVDTLDRTAGAIRGRAARVIHIINAEMENYEAGVYTEKVLEATKLLSETVMPRFAEQVEVAIEALSANVPQPFEENEFIDASRLVYDGVRDIRKAVLMIRTPEELEDDSDFEQEDYDVRSRTSVQTEDDQLIAGQSARAIMAQLPQEEKAKIAEQVEIFHQEKSKLDAEVAKWDDSGNDIIVLAKQMCMIMMEMTDFTRGKGPLKNTSDVINAAKKIAEAGSRMDKLARAVADQCPDSACKQDLLAYLQRIALYCHQLNICSKVKAEVQNLGGELIVSGTGVQSTFTTFYEVDCDVIDGGRASQLSTHLPTCAEGAPIGSGSSDSSMVYSQDSSIRLGEQRGSEEETGYHIFAAELDTIYLKMESVLDSATSLIQAAKNLMNAVVLTVKASYVASTKYQKVYGTAAVNSPVVSWKMKAPEKKPLVKREKPEEFQTRVRRGSQKKHISPVQALSEFKAMDSF
ncbi:unnamed protein product [Nyctereutes procyonoides]|uniref:Catenin alpha-2 n=1 Tax=Nyctereutes procyonoides TaxID=34880 RepID=A0A811ZUK7_NYCPR|nr:unnamed protein product [Nyctereutes procyonoides]